MQIFIARQPGWYGKLVPMDLLCNGKRLASLRERDEVCVRLEAADMPATLQVRMQRIVGSGTVVIPRITSAMHLECGASSWTLLDFFDLSFLPRFRDRVLYLRKVVPRDA